MTLTITSIPVFEPIPATLRECPRCNFPIPHLAREDLTDRERQVVALLAQGYSNKMIAKELGIQATTAKNHMTSVIRKTGSRDRTSAAMVALEKGWIKRVEQG